MSRMIKSNWRCCAMRERFSAVVDRLVVEIGERQVERDQIANRLFVLDQEQARPSAVCHAELMDHDRRYTVISPLVESPERASRRYLHRIVDVLSRQLSRYLRARSLIAVNRF